MESSFLPSKEAFTALFDQRSASDFEKTFTSGNELAKTLGAELKTGLDTRKVSLEERRQIFGINKLPPPVVKSFFDFVWEALSDRTLIVLCVSAAVSLAIGVYKMNKAKNPEPLAWIEGVSIIFAVLIVILVNSINDYRKQQKFQRLSKANDDLKMVKVYRASTVPLSIPMDEVVVGDVIGVETGDILCADGILLQGFNVKVDESSLTGETCSIKKSIEEDPFIISGTQVVDGTGRILVLAVGVNSVHGQSLERLQVEQVDTPLQVKLGRLAETIARYGLLFAVLLVLLSSAILVGKRFQNPGPLSELLEDLLGVFITGVTLVVVAVPEGLPMAVTVALAYGTLKMLQDNNLVRVLSSCETMGGATCIASDKTGTLTQNKMKVVSGTVAGHRFDASHISELRASLSKVAVDLPDAKITILDLLGEALSVNSTAYEQDDGKLTGNKTETAILEWLKHMEVRVIEAREKCSVVNQYPFSSERKSMCTVVEARFVSQSPRLVVYTKGAAELVKARCSFYVDENGRCLPLEGVATAKTNRQFERLAGSGLRAIGFAFKVVDPQSLSHSSTDEMPDSENLVWLGVVGIEDPLRPEVPEAVAQCRKSGVNIKMVTGDNVVTAKSIAKSCNILTDGGLIMEGHEFRRLSPEQMRQIVPRLQVLARSKPEDKQILVRVLQDLGEIVAVTGDGTNDAAALKASHVGFSMGIQGTDVAKEASDIILMDDNFASIVKAILWGRSIKACVQKFLQFQLTVNIVAVSITFISSLYSSWIGGEMDESESVLNPVQLLWVNLLMDTFAALALATEPPTDDLLDRPPADPAEPLINKEMKLMIVSQSFYQSVVFLALYFFGGQLMGLPAGSVELGTFIFNAFVMAQLFNEINCRKLGFSGKNPFKGILRNKVFIAVWIFSFVCQYFIVTYGSFVFQTCTLPPFLWGKSLAIGAGSLVVGLAVRTIGPHLITQSDLNGTRSRHALRKRSESFSYVPGVSVYDGSSGGKDSLLETKSSWNWLRAHRSDVLPCGKANDHVVFVGDRPGDKDEEECRTLLHSNFHDSQYPPSPNSQERWGSAIQRVRQQLSVVNAFRRLRRDAVPINSSKLGSPARK